MQELLEYDADTDLLLVYHTGEIEWSDIESSAPAFLAQVREHTPSRFLISLDHARWNLDIEQFQRFVRLTFEAVGPILTAIVTPTDIPDTQLAAIRECAAGIGMVLSFHVTEEEARNWLVSRQAPRETQANQPDAG